MKNYPGNPVVNNGCSSAWQGYVEYCICDTDLCNQKNLTSQQLTVGYVSPTTTSHPVRLVDRVSQLPYTSLLRRLVLNAS